MKNVPQYQKKGNGRKPKRHHFFPKSLYDNPENKFLAGLGILWLGGIAWIVAFVLLCKG